MPVAPASPANVGTGRAGLNLRRRAATVAYSPQARANRPPPPGPGPASAALRIDRSRARRVSWRPSGRREPKITGAEKGHGGNSIPASFLAPARRGGGARRTAPVRTGQGAAHRRQSGSFDAISRNAAAGLPSSARGTIASSGAVTVDADRVPTNATVNQNRIDRAGDVVSNTARTVIAGVPGANYGFEQSFSPATPPEALGRIVRRRRSPASWAGWFRRAARKATSSRRHPSSARTRSRSIPAIRACR